MWQRQKGRGRLFRSLRIFLVIAVAGSVYHLWTQAPAPRKIVVTPGSAHHHPIDDLITNATATFRSLVSKQTTTLNETADAYRDRRGRHPPPGFDAWHAFASAHNAVLVEDFFDQIYNDLSPFWSVPAKQIRQQARQLPNRIVVRNKKVQTRKGDRKRLDTWIDMVQKIQHELPDLDMPLNMLDEPRVAVPWENISSYIEMESDARQLQPTYEVVQSFTLKDIDGETVEYDEPKTFSDHDPYWDMVRVGCAPDAPSRNISTLPNLTEAPVFCLENECGPMDAKAFTYEGFISNWTRAKDPCLQPDLVSSHVALIEPLSQSTSPDLIPIFSSSKLSMVREFFLSR
jgi:hypothetical protein